MSAESDLRGVRGQLLTALLHIDAIADAPTPARALENLVAAEINVRSGWENLDRLLRNNTLIVSEKFNTRGAKSSR